MLLWGRPAGGQPQTLAFSILSERDGLLGYYHHDILQHSRGLLWIGSSLGLTRYDGYRFEPFTSYTTGLSGVNVERLQEFKDGRLVVLYVYERGFFDLFDPEYSGVTKVSLGPEGRIRGQVLDLLFEPRGDIYVLSRSAGRLYVQRYAGEGRFEESFSVPVDDRGERARLLRLRSGQFWISDDTGALRILDPKGRLLRRLTGAELDRAGGLPPARVFYQDRQGRVWYSPLGEPGLYWYDETRQVFRRADGLPADRLYDRVWEDQVGNLLFKCGDQEWYSDTGQLYLYMKNGSVEDYSSLRNFNKYVLSVFGHDFTRALYMGAGSVIRQIRFNQLSLRTYLSQPLLSEGQWGVSIRGIQSDGRGSVFLIREVDSWYRLELATGRLDTIPLRFTEQGDTIHWRQGGGIFVDDRYVWSAGSMNVGRRCLMRYDRQTGRFRAYEYPLLIEDFIRAADGDFWLVCNSDNKAELVRFDLPGGTFTPYRDADGVNPLANLAPYRLYQAKNGIIWIGAETGLVRVDLSRRRSRRYGAGKGDDNAGLTSNTVLAIREDDTGRLWLGTNDGVNVFDPGKERVVEVFRRPEGLAGNRVSNIEPDRQGGFWISTYSGLSYFDRRQRRFFNLFRSAGLPFEEINRRTLYLSEGGRLFIGGLNGAASLRPADMVRRFGMPAPVLTGWEQFDGRRDTLLVRRDGLSTMRSVNLSAHVLFFECTFAIPHYEYPESHQFSVWLEGYDHDWVFLGNTPSIRYNKLPAGRHRLHVRAMDAFGNASENDLVLTITVDQIYYRTWWFVALLLLALTALVLWLYRSRLERRMAVQHARQLRELDAFKTKLYANITHEFRSPLTIILGLARQLRQRSRREENRRDLLYVEQNGERLLSLVNQILDLRKLEVGTLRPDLVQGNVVPLLGHLGESFESLASGRNQTLSTAFSPGEIVMDHDPDLLVKIVSNLLSNAVKFTPAGGHISLTVTATAGELLIRVSDSGIGIPAPEQERIFDRFYQGARPSVWRDEGAGIGLTLVRELVVLLGGRISLDSRPEEGSTFCVSLPIRRTATPAAAAPFSPVAPAPDLPAATQPEDVDAGRPVVLIVEDHEEMARYVGSCLRADYHLVFAVDGEDGIRKAIECIPDLIISDVMMPRRDGFALCRTLKADERTSHIPIILLTGRVEAADRIEGLRRGADAYLGKPFREEELLLQVHNLLSLGRRLREYLMPAAPPAAEPGESAAAGHAALPEGVFDLQMENAFLQRVRSIIEDNLANAGFSVADLCREMTMSKSQLHRKLSALTGEPASRLLRRLRLQRAMELLRDQEVQIAEVAFQAGFNDPSYFTRIFSQDVGMTPSDYRARFGQ